MDTHKQTVFIAFSSQKGGVGKTTFTAMVASLLHYRLGYNVAVFDCDFPQHSLSKMRDRDYQAITHNEELKRRAYALFGSLNKQAYPVFTTPAGEALKKAQDYLQKSSVDIIFFDLPGTVNTPGVLTTLAGMNYIFSPITADRVVLESTLSFMDVLTTVFLKKGQSDIQSLQLFWNQVDGREKSALYHTYETVISKLGLHLMNAYIADTKRFRKENEQSRGIFRSTILPPDERLMQSCRLDQFIKEFLQIVKL